jgi:hypothetical protein
MRFSKSYPIAWLWVFVFLVFIWLRLGDSYLDCCAHTVLSEPKYEDNKPVGEVVSGFHIEQPINWDLLDKGVVGQDTSSAVCVSMLMANYSNRDNAGDIAISLRVDDHLHRVVMDAKTVQENVYHRVCFVDVFLGQIVHKPAALILEGIDSQPGHAVTAWMTKDIVHGGVVRSDGTVSDRGLMFRIEVVRGASKMRLHAIILMFIYGLSGIFIFLAASGRTVNASLKKSNISQKDNQ